MDTLFTQRAGERKTQFLFRKNVLKLFLRALGDSHSNKLCALYPRVVCGCPVAATSGNGSSFGVELTFANSPSELAVLLRHKGVRMRPGSRKLHRPLPKLSHAEGAICRRV